MEQSSGDLVTAETLKRRGMARAARRKKAEMRVLRWAAKKVAARDGDADADRVRLYLDERDMLVSRGNHWGSIFCTKDWEFTGRRVNSTLKHGHANEIKVWRLKTNG